MICKTKRQRHAAGEYLSHRVEQIQEKRSGLVIRQHATRALKLL